MIEQTPTPAPSIDPITSPEVRIPSITPSPKKLSILPGILIGILLTSTAVFAYGYFSKIPKTAIVPLPPTATPAPSVAPTSVPDSTFGQITWLDKPVKVSNPDVLKTSGPNGELPQQTEAYKVATFSSGSELIVSFIAYGGMGNTNIYRIIKDKNQYNLIESLIVDKDTKNELNNIFDKTKIKFISYDTLGLLPPDYINVGNQVFITAPAGLGPSQFFPSLKNPVKYLTSPHGDFYSVYTDAYKSQNILGREIFLKLPDFTLLSYRLDTGFTSDDKVPRVTFTSGGINKDQFEPGIPFQCGLGTASTVIKANSSLLIEKQEVGNVTYSPDKKIYQIKNIQNELLKVLYDNYKTGRDYPSAPPIMSIDQYNETHNHFLYQDLSGDWIVYVNSQYAPMVECGKPVIYLYPTQDTVINVKVGADMSQSDPLYPSDGWTVLAKPSGNLTYQNQSYPYLFWEGMGWGTYPDYQNRGVVVSQQNLIRTLKSQLSQLGLNTQESADFMEFWQSRLPQTPYVRLTWLNTADMNRLAPLAVNPRPDTVIRIFLEFEGLQQPRPLIPQSLTSVPRRGFTLVEWGGLLIKGK
ncbi:MAG: hypothetical protein WC596_01815 [Candidatus Shapirobacteria bacterium]